ncbi:hypothetical protein GCM10028791_19550 [Echinicola sediminis]
MKENQAVWRLRHSTAMVNLSSRQAESKTAAKRLILSAADQSIIDMLMNISGLIDPPGTNQLNSTILERLTISM